VMRALAEGDKYTETGLREAVVLLQAALAIDPDSESARSGLAALRADPKSELLAGGTDLMVDVNFGRKRVGHVIALDRVEELQRFDIASRTSIGAGVTYAQLLRMGAGSVALAQAARTVGSPQIRNAGTIGGNVATSSPAGDTLPVLAALEAEVVLRSLSGDRHVPFSEFMTGPKRNARAHDEIVTSIEWDDAGPWQTFLKVGTRNAMVIAVASLALVVDRTRRRVGIALGSCGPTILRATDAEWSRHVDGPTVSGRAAHLASVLAGRPWALQYLTGDGVTVLTSRV